jgi:hypothetical protein
MKARYLRGATLEELRGSIFENLDHYRTGNFNSLKLDTTLWFEHETEVLESHLGEMKQPLGAEYYEVENCMALHDAFANLSPYEARDERLWAYYVHTDLLAYARARWPIPKDQELAVAHIAKHFFARDKRQTERDNAASRLWWMAHLCARVVKVPRKEALAAFLYRSDVRANLIERPTTSQSTELFGAILNKLVISLAGDRQLFERRAFRRLMSSINSVGGYKLIDCLDSGAADQIVSELIEPAGEAK